MFLATCFGGLDVVQVLIKNNADVTLKNKSGKTALNYGNFKSLCITIIFI